jgi:hypothetical protein
MGLFFYIYNENFVFRYLSMVINDTTTQIYFFPVISFENIASVNVEVWHKNTKTMVQDISSVTQTGTKVVLSLPDLTDINDVAKNLDVCLIRVYDGSVMIWEYLATWSNESTNNYAIFKEFQTTETINPRWVTL